MTADNLYPLSPKMAGVMTSAALECVADVRTYLTQGDYRRALSQAQTLIALLNILDLSYGSPINPLAEIEMEAKNMTEIIFADGTPYSEEEHDKRSLCRRLLKKLNLKRSN